jgi:cytochrome c oxidase cbb3-type subunit 4
MANSFMDFLGSLWAVWMMMLFCGIVLWAYWPRNKAKIESYGRIPLSDDDEER